MASARVAPEEAEMKRYESLSLASIQHNDEAMTATDVGTGNYPVHPDISWIIKNIKRRECKRFVVKPKKSDTAKKEENVCSCGHSKRDHPEKAFLSKDDQKWDSSKDTEAFPTNAFGEIEFPGYGDNVSKFVRVDHLMKMSTILNLMTQRWNLVMPNLLISVTGGAKNFHMKTRLKDVFQRGLMKAALSTGAWIVTGGTNAGVMKHVGEAVRDFGLTAGPQGNVICIGVAPWGCVQGKEELIDNMGKWPALHRIVNKPLPKQSCLDPNHSHFILVDNGTQHEFAVEIPFRTKLENEISNQKTNTGSGVPVVLLVLEGGPGTLETCMSAIQNDTPAVIIEGSGRAADILAYAYQNSTDKVVPVTNKEGETVEMTQSEFSPMVEADIYDMIKSEFGEKDVASRVGWVKKCLEKRVLVTIYQLDNRSTKDMDIAILKALFKANSEKVMDQLRLALAWNRIDVAKSEIFTDSREWKSGQLDDMMLKAIQLNRVDFVDLFLDNGVSIKDFLTPDRLRALYSQIPKNTLLFSLLKKAHSRTDGNEFNLADLGRLLQILVGDYYLPYYLEDPEFSKPSLGELHRPIQELFIWCVLLNRQELAKLFWKEGNEQTAAALVANAILKSLRDNTDDAEVMNKLQTNADEFEDLAIGVLNSCYNTDEQKAQDLLIRELENWGHATCVMIAVQADNKRFVSHTACQSLLNNIWMGKLSLDNGKIKLISSIVFFPLIWVIIRFREEEKAKLEAGLSAGDVKKQLEHQPKISREETTMTLNRQGTRFDMKESLAPIPQSQSKINPFMKLMLFYTAPVVIFSLNVGSYLIFLGIYSYILVSVFQPQFSAWEGVLIGWVFTIMVEELRQIVTNNATSIKSKLYSYVTDSWNILDIITIVLFMIGMILRAIPNNDNCFQAARVILSINLISFFFRILHIFSVNKQLGPKLVMIRRMVDDLIYFVVILLVFIIAYAIASEAVLYPNQSITWSLLYNVPRKAYWTIYGELFLEEIEGAQTCTENPLLYENGTIPRCPSSVGRYFVPILMAVYILMTNVLLLNLLIAMFSYTFQQIQDNTELYWYFQRFQLIIEYHSRPPLPPPLIIICHIWFLVKSCCGLCQRKKRDPESSDLRKKFDNKLEEKQLVQWENVIADTYLLKTEEREKESVEHRVHSALVRLDQISSRVEDIQDSQSVGPVTVKSEGGSRESMIVPQTKLFIPPEVNDRLKLLETQMALNHKALNWLMKSLSQHNLASKESMPMLPDPDDAEKKRKKAIEEEEKRDRELVAKLRKQRFQYHFESRSSPYPETHIVRYPVPDEKVQWKESFEEYKAVNYTSSTVFNQPWADVDLMAIPVSDRNVIPFNKYDEKCGVDRKSHLGKYDIEKGLPKNPRGRTGLCGRGSLGRWGPNHAGDPVVTRWKLNKDGSKVKIGGKPLLEFVVVKRSDNKQWALPGAICDPRQEVWDILKTDFTNEAVGTLIDDPKKKETITEEINKLSKMGEEVYRSYADDSRNTDNAWIETRVVNYHDEEGTILHQFELRAGDTVEAATWQTMSSSLSLHGSHSYFCQLVAEKHGAFF